MLASLVIRKNTNQSHDIPFHTGKDGYSEMKTICNIRTSVGDAVGKSGFLALLVGM